MAFADILVHLDTLEGPFRPLEAALVLGRNGSTHVVGLHVSSPIISAMAVPDVYPQVYGMLRELEERDTETVKAAFLTRMALENLPHEFRHEEGDPLSVVAAHGRYADLIVVGQPGGEAAHSTIAHELAIVAGRPLLVVPRSAATSSIGKDVLIAWNGRREAARAIGDAMPLLRTARQVQVLTVSTDADGAREDAVAAADMAAHLARHGVKAEARHETAPESGIADLVLSSVSDLGADLVVMGAYGHSRFREIILGGATRDMLQNLTVPVLLSH